MILSEHLVHCDTDGVDFKTPWYNWTIGRLQQVFLMVSFLFFSLSEIANASAFIFSKKKRICFKCLDFCYFPAPRAGGEVLDDPGDAPLHAGSGPQHTGRVPAVPGPSDVKSRERPFSRFRLPPEKITCEREEWDNRKKKRMCFTNAKHHLWNE